MSKVAAKPAALIHAVALPVALENIAAQIAGAMQETASLSETLGTLTRDAGKLIKKNPDMLDPFIDACRQLCASCGLTEGSFKVYMSNIRGVVRAMIDGYAPKDGQSLRAMYDGAPKGKGANKGNTTKGGARHNTKAASVESDDASEVSAPVVPNTPTKAKQRHDAMITLFGHCDDELDAAVQWAAAHELRFINLVKSQIAFDNAPAKVRKAA